MATPQLNAGALLDALLASDWMIRRKDTVAFGTESLLRRTHSFDFTIPQELLIASNEGSARPAAATVPLGFWWKAPGKYTNIDFVDEAGNSLPLSTSTTDEDVTVAVMYEYAARILCCSLSAIHVETLQGIANIVQQDAIESRNEVKNTWLSRPATPIACALKDRERIRKHPADISKAEIAMLAQDDGFAALLEVCAMASIFTVVLHNRLDERRIVKLRYDETCTGLRGTDTYERPASFPARIRGKLRSIALLLGLASYDVDMGNAFVRARRYHFEEDAPPGLRFTSVTSKRAAETSPQAAVRSDPRVHLYQKDLATDTYLTVRGKLVVADDWLNLAIVCTAVALAVLIGIVNNIETLNPKSSQSVITLAVLVPSIAMSIVWRRVHWLVVRLQGWLRLAFGSLGVFLFYLALRIAESPTKLLLSNHATLTAVPSARLAGASQIKSIAIIAMGWGVVVSVLLILARIKSARANR
jgi:uncharacterized protein YsxB (DUF464 family)